MSRCCYSLIKAIDRGLSISISSAMMMMMHKIGADDDEAVVVYFTTKEMHVPETRALLLGYT